MLPPLRLALPCPHCHAMGGGGLLQRFTPPGGEPLFACHECELCFPARIHPADFRPGDALDVDALLAAQGSDLHAELLRAGAARWMTDLTLPANELMVWVQRAATEGEVFAPGYAGAYRQIDTRQMLNAHGHTVLVVQISQTETLAYAAPRLQPAIN